MKEIGLSKSTTSLLQAIFKKSPSIEQVKLYGSRAKGSFNERSDIDLVTYGVDIDRSVIADVLMDLDDSDIPYLFDLQNYHDLKNQQLINHIDRVGLLIYQKAK